MVPTRRSRSFLGCKRKVINPHIVLRNLVPGVSIMPVGGAPGGKAAFCKRSGSPNSRIENSGINVKENNNGNSSNAIQRRSGTESPERLRKSQVHRQGDTANR